MTGTFRIKTHYTFEEREELYRAYNESTRKSYEEWLKRENEKKEALDK